MRKILLTAAAVLCLSLCLTVPALAAQDYGLIYDATNLLDSDVMSTLSNETFYNLSAKHKVQVRVDVVDNLEDETIDDYAQIFYDNYGYGYEGTGDGILLMVYVKENDRGDLEFCEYTVLPGGPLAERVSETDLKAIQVDLDALLTPQNFAGGLESDNSVMENALLVFTRDVGKLLGDGDTPTTSGTEGGETASEPTQPESVLAYVTDSAFLLSAEEVSSLEASAKALSQQYNCGVYVVTVDDYNNYTKAGEDKCAAEIFSYYNLGLGEAKNGVLLVVSLAQKSYGLFANGDVSAAPFDKDGKAALADKFQGKLQNEDWYGGISGYVKTVEAMLEEVKNAAAQEPEPEPEQEPEPEPEQTPETAPETTAPEEQTETQKAEEPERAPFTGNKLAVSLTAGGVVGCLAALVTCLILKGKMKNVQKATAAKEYVVPNGVKLTAKADTYTHTTQKRETTSDPATKGKESKKETAGKKKPEKSKPAKKKGKKS